MGTCLGRSAQPCVGPLFKKKCPPMASPVPIARAPRKTGAQAPVHVRRKKSRLGLFRFATLHHCTHQAKASQHQCIAFWFWHCTDVSNGYVVCNFVRTIQRKNLHTIEETSGSETDERTTIRRHEAGCAADRRCSVKESQLKGRWGRMLCAPAEVLKEISTKGTEVSTQSKLQVVRWGVIGADGFGWIAALANAYGKEVVRRAADGQAISKRNGARETRSTAERLKILGVRNRRGRIESGPVGISRSLGAYADKSKNGKN